MNQEEKWLLEEKYAGVESEAFREDLILLQSGTPLAYLIGSIPFLNCAIFLDSHPLIPRPETEYWTEKAIKEIKKNPQGNRTADILGLSSVRVLDLCAGSGAVGVAVAKEVPLAQVVFGEIDKEHIPTIEKNLAKNRIIYDTIQYAVVESDLFENISGTFDFILTNPPYIDPAIDRAERSVKLHEPHLALYGGVAGMECIEKIIAGAPRHLVAHGQLWIEHEPEQTTAIAACAKKAGFTATTHNDQYGLERYSILVLQ